MNFEYRRASICDLERIWDKSIKNNHGDKRYIKWKNEFIKNNHCGLAQTFIIFCDNEPVGEGSLLFSPECSAVRGRKLLCDGAKTANINALRIEKSYEGKGHISRLVRLMEKTARDLGYAYITIGVEAKETRNIAIYLHWGYDEFVLGEIEDGQLVLYYRKNLI